MQKIILDTNVIVSALISNSFPTKILYELVLKQRVETVLSLAVYQEYAEVLNSEKFSNFCRIQNQS
jgi:putative PIN family toxin of toxin-antitoxin system